MRHRQKVPESRPQTGFLPSSRVRFLDPFRGRKAGTSCCRSLAPPWGAGICALLGKSPQTPLVPSPLFRTFRPFFAFSRVELQNVGRRRAERLPWVGRQAEPSKPREKWTLWRDALLRSTRAPTTQFPGNATYGRQGPGVSETGIIQIHSQAGGDESD